MALNYFKVFEKLPGDGRPFVGAQAFEFFDDTDAASMTAAYKRAYESPLRDCDCSHVSVYRFNAAVPSHVPIIGINPDMRKARAAKQSIAVLDMRDAHSEPVASAIGGE